MVLLHLRLRVKKTRSEGEGWLLECLISMIHVFCELDFKHELSCVAQDRES